MADIGGMFKFRRTQNDVDTSLFDPEQDMDLLIMIDNSRTEADIQSVVRISRARMRARRRQIEAERHPQLPESTRVRGFSPPSSLLRGF
jgi:hypothetical protein